MTQSFAGLTLDRPRVMGIVNVTPDSFSDGGRLPSVDIAVAHALALRNAGADILDIGGESTRPGSDTVEVDEELARVIPVISSIRARSDALISIDTRKTAVMREAVAAGADIINDVAALTFDPEAVTTVADLGVPVILMHARGDPKTMQDNPHYDDVVAEVRTFLDRRVATCEQAGIPRQRIAIDPGIGFGKSLEHNLTLLRNLDAFTTSGLPLMVGASRKRFIGTITDTSVAAGSDVGFRRSRALGCQGRCTPFACPRCGRNRPSPEDVASARHRRPHAEHLTNIELCRTLDGGSGKASHDAGSRSSPGNVPGHHRSRPPLCG